MNGESVARDGHRSHVQCGQEVPLSEPSVTGAAVRSRPGILIFSRRQQLLHVNRRAWELIGHLDQTEIGPISDMRLALVRELCAQIQEALALRKNGHIRERVEIKRYISDSARTITLRGFGLPDRNGLEDSRSVILVEESGLQQEPGEAVSFKVFAVSPWDQHDGDSKAEISDANEADVFRPSLCLDRM